MRALSYMRLGLRAGRPNGHGHGRGRGRRLSKDSWLAGQGGVGGRLGSDNGPRPANSGDLFN